MQDWLDLSEHGLSLILFKTKKTHYLVVRGEGVEAYKGVVNPLGLTMQTFGSDGETILIKQLNAGKAGPIVNLPIPAWTRAFKGAKKVKYDPAIHLNDMTVAPAAPATTAESASVDTTSVDRNAAIHLGTNRLGFEVFQDARGRFVRDNRGETSFESEVSPANPGMFLRGLDAASIDSCAEALVRLADRKRVFRPDEFKKFAAIVFDVKEVSEADLADLRAAVTRAIPRLLAARTNKTAQDLFVMSGQISENLPFLRGPGAEPIGLPAPMGMAAQRVLGTETALRGKKVTIVAGEPTAFSSNLAKSAVVSFDQADIAGADFLVMEAMATDSTPGTVRGFDFNRRDYAAALVALDSKAAEGVSVIVLDAPQNADERIEFETMRQSIATTHAFHADARVNSALWQGQTGTDEDKIMFAVGNRFEENVAEPTTPEPRAIDDWAQLWSWTAEVVAQRQRAALRVVDGGDPDAGVAFRSADAERNQFQTPYVSASAIGTPKTMVPRNLDGAMRDALETVVRKLGPVDALVMKEYGYTRDELAAIFSPEQIDALALHVYAEDRGRDFLVADEMGVGKGRTLAAVMRRAVLKGQKVVFLTERETNLSDIWRDIVATRSDNILKPFLLNTDGKIIDRETRDVVLRGPSAEESANLIATMAFPEGANLVLSTYTQHSREVDWKWDSEASIDDPASYDVVSRTLKDYRKITAEGAKYPGSKSLYLTAIVDASTKIVGDESHNATGDSNISETLTMAVERAGSATWSSATWAADASRVSFYAGLFPDELSVPELSAMMVKGGETFQEVLSAMLVKDGVMVRREFDLSNLTFETITDTARFERNRDYMDAVAPVIAELSALSSEVERRVSEANRGRRARRAGEPQNGDAAPEVNGNSPYRVTRSSFGQPLYVISRLFVAALRVDAVVESAIECLENGEKPVILVDNTLQELFEEIAAADVDTEGAVIDFRALMSRVLRKMVTTSVFDQQKNETFVHDISRNDPKLGAMVARIQRMIADMPSISVSVIDDVKRRIREAGWTIDEITGRTLQLQNGKVMRRPIANPTEIKNDFNDGILDVVMINTGGTTGIDLHASATFKDQRRRVLHELQPPMDVVKKTQAHGRVNRYDQVSYPKIRRFQTGLPAEMRLDAMENAKLRRLSANTRSNRDSATLMRDIPDLINTIGDMVCSRYAEQRPDLMRRLGLNVGQVQAAVRGNTGIEKAAGKSLAKDVSFGKTKDTEAARTFVVADGKRTANEILARLIMLPVDMQTKVCNELTAEYYAAVEELEARGETPLRTNELQGIVHERSRRIMDGAEAENADSVFHQPLYVLNAALERTADPLKSDDILQRIELGEMASARSQTCIDRIKADMDDILKQYLPMGAVSVEQAIANGNKEIIQRKERLERLVASLGEIRPGRDISFTVDGDVVKGIVTQVEYPNRGYEGVTGMYGIEFAVPGDLKYRTLRLETLLRDQAFAIGPGLEVADYDAVLKRFDDAVVTKVSSVRLMTNNIFRAVQLNVGHRLGRLVTYTAADGTRHRAIAISNRHRNLDAIPVEINSAGMAYDAVKAGYELVGDGGLSDKVFSVRPIENMRVEVRLPARTSRKYGHVYDSRVLLGLLAEAEVKSKPVVTLTHEQFRTIAEEFQKVGARLWMTPLARDWANQRLAGVIGRQGPDDDQDDDNDDVRLLGMGR